MFILEGKDCKDLRNNWSNVQTEEKPNNFKVLYNNDLNKKENEGLFEDTIRAKVLWLSAFCTTY